MPLNVRRSFASLFLVVFGFLILTNAQTTPTSGEVMRGRVSKAKAFIAVKNYNAAIYELENIRRETSDQSVQGVLNVLLMNCYLEQGDYKRAQDFLGALFNDVKVNKPNATANYYAAAGQIIKGARNQSDRYKALGLMVSDRNLPPEAATDLENMRATLEKVVDQSKILGKDAKQPADAFVLLEESASARSLLARDDYDSKRWKDEAVDSREMIANSRSTVANAVNDSIPETIAPSNSTVASTTKPVNTLPVPSETTVAKADEPKTVLQPVRDTKIPVVETKADVKADVREAKPAEPTVGETNSATTTDKPKRERRVVKNETESDDVTADPSAPMSVGSLLEYAVQKQSPIYPPTARSMRQSGVVRLEVIVDEEGKVTKIQNSSGPALLQTAAKDAAKKWKFKPFLRDGQPVKATGFLSFNFNL